MVVDVDDLTPSVKAGSRLAKGRQRSAVTARVLAEATVVRRAVLYLMNFHGCTGV